MPYKDPEKAKEYWRNWKRSWRKANPEQAKENDLKYDMTRREKKRDYNHSYYETNLETEKARSLRWADKNPEKAFARGINYKYGLSIEEYNALVIKQNKQCAICKEETKLYIDHCHTTDKVRGLLCNLCNAGLGMFRENTVRLVNTIEYIKEHSIAD